MNPQINAMIGQGIQAFQDGNIQGAELILQRVVKAFPTAYPALQILGLIKVKQENYLEAILYFKKALKINGNDPSLLYNLGQAFISSDQIAEAASILAKCTKVAPNHPGAWFSLGKCLNWLGRNNEALEALERAIGLDASNSQTLMTKGLALRSLGRFEDAVQALSNALEGEPENFAAWLDLGHSLGELKRYDEALVANDHAISILPNDAKAWYNRGALLCRLGKYDEALIANEHAIGIFPDHIDAWANKGSILRELKHFKEALAATENAISLDKSNFQAWLTMGAIFRDLHNLEMASFANERALELSPDNPDAWFNRALILSDASKNSDALLAYEKAKELGSKSDYLEGNLITLRMHLANWEHVEAELNTLLNKLRDGLNVVMPFTLLSLIDDSAIHLEASRLFIRKVAPNKALPIGALGYSHRKIRIGYFSSDLREHPVGMLIGEMIDQHNRNQFEVYGFSLLAAKNGDIFRDRLVRSYDHFIHCDALPDDEIVAKARECEIDIAIDLNGHTQDNRPSIFALGVAPLQINYLGYPGTMGATFMDYIIADKTIIPADSHQFYTEKVAYLPNSYLMYDSMQKLASYIPTRVELGLPDNAFVFCGFNNGYKISKEVLIAWSAILRSIDRSVLWLTENNIEFKKNILIEFSKAGVSPERIIFASRVDKVEDHLARLKQADLFLDAWPYNAHSTGMDVLNAGVPILTKVGKSFAARVGASLLTSLNLLELITHSTDEYEAKAIQLANNPTLLKEIKAKVQDPNIRAKLFDTKQFTQSLESLYKQMYELKQAGLPAQNLYADS